MGDGYIGILVLACVAAAICAVFVVASWLLGPKKVTRYKSSPYECGVEPVGDARERFPVKFYLVAMLFILFDIEVVFLWPWMTVFKNATNATGGKDISFITFSFYEMLTYMTTWIVGYVYALRVNAMDWDESTTLHPAKLGDGATDEPVAVVGGTV